MTSQTSQKTEDMLDQTFANFENEVTGATGTATAATRAASSGGTKKSSNTILFVGMGIAAVAVVGYMFVVKPMLEPPPMPQKPIVAAVQSPQQAPVATQQSVQQTSQGAVVVQQQSGMQAQQNPLEAFKNSQPEQGQAATPVVEQVPSQKEALPVQAAVQEPKLEKPVMPQQQEVKQVGAAPVSSVPDVVKVGNTASNEADLIALSGQQEEFKNILSTVNTRVSKIEEVILEQSNVNKKVDERLSALESGKAVKKPVVVKQEVVEGSQPVVKKVKPVAKKEKVVDESNILVDKSGLTQAKKVETPKEKEFAPYKIHSIYGGRLWLKNEDGSLSTYSVGDKLPSGETIKKIDDDMHTVTTDSRLLKY